MSETIKDTNTKIKAKANFAKTAKTQKANEPKQSFFKQVMQAANVIDIHRFFIDFYYI